MYKCHEIKNSYSFMLTDAINSWFNYHQDVKLIDISIVHNERLNYFHAFITYSEQESML